MGAGNSINVDIFLILCFMFQTHSGSVWRVTWAHPEFGQVIATCSFDRTAAIWEELRKSKQLEILSQC